MAKESPLRCVHIIEQDSNIMGLIFFGKQNDYTIYINCALIDPKYWGHNRTVTMLKIFLEYYIAQPKIYRIWAMCHIDNVLSAKLMERAGMTREGKIKRRGIFPNISNTPEDVFMFSYTV